MPFISLNSFRLAAFVFSHGLPALATTNETILTVEHYVQNGVLSVESRSLTADRQGIKYWLGYWTCTQSFVKMIWVWWWKCGTEKLRFPFSTFPPTRERVGSMWWFANKMTLWIISQLVRSLQWNKIVIRSDGWVFAALLKLSCQQFSLLSLKIRFGR